MKKEKIKDVIAGIISIIFIGLVFFLYFNQMYEGAFILGNKFTGLAVYNPEVRADYCTINTPYRTIILRLDDVRAYSKLTEPLVDEILKRNSSVTLGVIPRNLEKDKAMIKYLQEIKENPLVEIAQHGNYHNESDIEINETYLLEGYLKIQEKIGVSPVTYIPPFNEISWESKEAISKHFKIISGEQGAIREGYVAEIGYTEETYWYDKNISAPLQTVIDGCEKSLEKTNICVIAIHPQEYAININNAVELDTEKFIEFERLLNGLQELNASFANFKDIVRCG